MGLNDCHDGNARTLLAPHCQPSRPEQNSDKAIPNGRGARMNRLPGGRRLRSASSAVSVEVMGSLQVLVLWRNDRNLGWPAGS